MSEEEHNLSTKDEIQRCKDRVLASIEHIPRGEEFDVKTALATINYKTYWDNISDVCQMHVGKWFYKWVTDGKSPGIVDIGYRKRAMCYRKE
jgi:hypothetical protein